MNISSQAANLVSKFLGFFFGIRRLSFLQSFLHWERLRSSVAFLLESWSRRCEHANEIMSTAYPLLLLPVEVNRIASPGLSHPASALWFPREWLLLHHPNSVWAFYLPLFSPILSCSHHRSISRQGSSEKCPDAFLAGVTSCPEFDKLMAKNPQTGQHDEILLIPFHLSHFRSFFLLRSMTLYFQNILSVV